MLLTGIEVAASGILLAYKDYEYVQNAMLRTLLVTFGFVTVSQLNGWGLSGIWWSLVVFFSTRAAQSVLRLSWLLLKRRHEAPLPA